MKSFSHPCRFMARHRSIALTWTVVLASLAGGTQMQSLKHKVGDALGAHAPTVSVEKGPATARSASAPAVDSTPLVPLKRIVAEQLQHGHYAEGKRQLHRYLQAHPDDRAARSLWHQLTIDPDRQLGSRSRIHVVQPGESYSSLAARYLGDADRFLVLARYNGASDPSLLQVGQRIRVPASGHVASAVPAAAARDVATRPAAKTRAPMSDHDKAEQLQQQSVALADQGRHAQALKQLDKALTLDPGLASSGDKADTLRKQLLSSYHQRAIVLYRDQKLKPAIALWDKILGIDPNYEPAIIYRTRARELQSRLKQF
jgi:tetratricopeptide (TPR) repeat protein